MRVRPAAPGDIPDVTALERASFSDPWSARAFRDLLARPEVIFAVAEAPGDGEGAVAGEVAGFVVLYAVAGEGDLANLAVRPAWRRGGVGRGLLRHALAAAQARGVHAVFLEVRESNVGARGLYAAEGFVPVGRRARYYAAPVEDALVLRRDL